MDEKGWADAACEVFPQELILLLEIEKLNASNRR